MDALLKRQRPSFWEQFRSSPLLFLGRLFYSRSRPPPAPRDNVRIVCISDTHNSHILQPPLPDADILIHAGDLTSSGTRQELDDALSWLDSQTHPHKLVIAGNHDTCLSEPDIRHSISENYPSLTYLQEASANINIRGRNLRVYGSPYTPKHGSWVFQYPRISPPLYSPSKNPEYESTKIWSRIPPLTDILVTHGPPLGHLDLDRTGCYALLTALWRIRPKLHVFGHIHAARGVEFVTWDEAQKAYEEVCAGRVGWSGLIRMIWWTLVAWFWRRHVAATIMINAASVGGFRDDQRLGAIVIEI